MMNFHDDMGAYGGNASVIQEGGESCSYGDLQDIADELGKSIGRRTLVFAVCENGLESVAGYLGFLRTRIVPVLVNSTLHPGLFDNLLNTYRPEYVWLPREKISALKCGDEVFSFGRYALLRTRFEAPLELHGDLAQLITTSGSTGSPMLVRQSYKNINSNAAAIAESLGIGAGSRPITTLPMSYTYGLSIINSHLLKGSSIVLTNRTLMDKGFWELLRKHEATTFGGVPYVYEMLKKLNFARMDQPSLKVLTQAGGKLNLELTQHFAAICEQKKIRFNVMYGQTEATARMSCLPAEFAVAKAGSIGLPIPNGKFWLEDDNGRVIEEPERAGELVYQGDNVMMGYANSHADLKCGDELRGILRTGDMARRDADGFYYIVGRKKRFLKLFGNRINLEELEHLIHEAGFPCACAGEDDHLRIFTTDTENHAKIKEFVAGRTAIHPSAFHVIHIESIPRNEAGKILYSELK